MHEEADSTPQAEAEGLPKPASEGPGEKPAASTPTESASGGQAPNVPGNTHSSSPPPTVPRTKMRRRVRHKRVDKSKKVAAIVWKVVMFVLALVVAAALLAVIYWLVESDIHAAGPPAS